MQVLKKIGIVFLSFLILGIVWQIFIIVGKYPEALFPSPLKVAEAIGEMIKDYSIFVHIQVSFTRFFIGYLSAVVCAVLIGLIVGRINWLWEITNPIVQVLRPVTPLALGLIEESIASIRRAKDYQFGGNQYLPVQADALEQEYQELLKQAENILSDFQAVEWKSILQLRLQAALLALRTTQAEMLHQGSAGYLQKSAPSRRLREAYFYINLTPSVRHLSKLLHQLQ